MGENVVGMRWSIIEYWRNINVFFREIKSIFEKNYMQFCSNGIYDMDIYYLDIFVSIYGIYDMDIFVSIYGIYDMDILFRYII